MYSTSPCRSREVDVHVGDMFEVTTSSLGGVVDAVWDRAAFVGTLSCEGALLCFDFVLANHETDMAYRSFERAAIDPKDRVQYGKLLSDVVKPGGKILLQVFEYDQSIRPGPPHR